MGKKGKKISIRHIDKEKVRELLKYGDLKEIAKQLPLHYQSVARIIRKLQENDIVWETAVQYLNDLPKTELNKRLAEELTKSEAA